MLFTPEDHLTIYRSQTWPEIECCSQECGAASNLSDATQKHAIRLNEKPDVTDILPLFTRRRKLRDLYMLYRYFNCCQEIADLDLPLAILGRPTRATQTS